MLAGGGMTTSAESGNILPIIRFYQPFTSECQMTSNLSLLTKDNFPISYIYAIIVLTST
jgi:hypothetical protein